MKKHPLTLTKNLTFLTFLTKHYDAKESYIKDTT